MSKVKLLTVGKGGVTAHAQNCDTSGYIGHNWTGDVDETTVCIDSREIPWERHCRLAIAGPMVSVDLPPGTVNKAFRPLQAWQDDGDLGNASSLSYVSVDVYQLLHERYGAK